MSCFTTGNIHLLSTLKLYYANAPASLFDGIQQDKKHG